MSLSIDIDTVSAVLLADGWHDVIDDSFEVDAYEYVQGKALRFRGGQSALIPATGFQFKEAQGVGGAVMVYGPLTAILAVKGKQDAGHVGPF